MTFRRERNALQSEHSAAQEGGNVHLSEHFYLQVWLPSLRQIQLLAFSRCRADMRSSLAALSSWVSAANLSLQRASLVALSS